MWILFFNMLIILDSNYEISSFEETSVTHPSKRTAFKRVARETLYGMGGQYLPRIEAFIISNCKANGYTSEANELQGTYNEMKSCIKNKTMIITAQNVYAYIANIEECSKESIRRTKSCLPDHQKYLPEFILDLVKSMVNFMYKNEYVIRYHLAACMPKFHRNDVKRSYIQCLTETILHTHDNNNIPTSKASLCQKFVPAGFCFTNMIKDTCDRTDELDQFRDDYISAVKRPCEELS